MVRPCPRDAGCAGDVGARVEDARAVEVHAAVTGLAQTAVADQHRHCVSGVHAVEVGARSAGGGVQGAGGRIARERRRRTDSHDAHERADAGDLVNRVKAGGTGVSAVEVPLPGTALACRVKTSPTTYAAADIRTTKPSRERNTFTAPPSFARIIV